MTQLHLLPNLPAPTVADNCEWYTPPHIIEAARAVLGTIDLDPASCVEANRIVQATRIYTRDDNGLEQPWHGNVWLNPPYGRGIIEAFVERLLEWNRRLVSWQDCYWGAHCLTNACTDTAWWQALAQESTVCFLRGRVRFWGPMEHGNSPTQGQTVFLLTENMEVVRRFRENFGPLGHIMEVP